jgi:poly-gamma-glutamate synthesis protein (capsule biosynthesis protein)
MQQVNYKKFNPVITLSTKGKILVSIVRFFYQLRQWLSKDEIQAFVPDHHEDPLTMTFAEQLYLGNKYYFRAMTLTEQGSGLESYFSNQTLQPAIPANFIPTQTITLHAGGDLIPYTSIQPSVCTNLWKNTGHFFFDADIVFANLEAPADFTKPSSAAPEVMLHDMYFNADEAMLKIFTGNGQFKGYDVLSVANNHSLDMGVDGLVNTLQLLQQKGIA